MNINSSEALETETFERPLAYRHRPGETPTIVFLPGYMSDMEGSKALALDAWAQAEGRAFLRFDYGGCGTSGGDFAKQRLADWRDDALAMIESSSRISSPPTSPAWRMSSTPASALWTSGLTRPCVSEIRPSRWTADVGDGMWEDPDQD